MFLSRTNFFKKIILLSLGLTVALLLAACGESKPLPTWPPAPPTPKATPSPTPVPSAAYFASRDYPFADDAERALLDFVQKGPPFQNYFTWTEGNRWQVVAKESDAAKMRGAVGAEARIFPVTYFLDGLNAGQRGNYGALILPLSRASLNVQANGAKEIIQQLYGRAQTGGVRQGLLTFAVSDDLAYAIVPRDTPAELVLQLASVGKLEVVSVGDKALPENTIVTTSKSPVLSDFKPKEANVYDTLLANEDFTSIEGGNVNNAPALKFEIKPGTPRLFEYTRSNLGKYTALVFDRVVLSSARISTPVRERAQYIVPRFSGANGNADMQRLLGMVGAKPSQLFEAKEVFRSTLFFNAV
jgi:hypothetical protein